MKMVDRNSIFKSMASRFQFKFKSRYSAAEILGESLKGSIKNENKEDIAIFGIPRAGLITADIISKKLSVFNFHIIIPRKLTDPDNKEQAIGAIMEDGTFYLNQQIVDDLQITQSYIEREKRIQTEEIRRRTSKYCETRTENRDLHKNTINYKTIIVADDGAATGATMIACIRWLRQPRNPTSGVKRIIIAIPIAPKQTIKLLERECNAEVKTVLSPSSSFHSLEQYHKNFEQVSDEQVVSILKERKLF